MAAETQRIETRIADDPRTAHGPMAAILTRPPKNVVYRRLQAQGPTSLAPTWQWLTTSKMSGVSRRIWLRSQGFIRIPIAGAVANSYSTKNIALRPYALQSNMSAITLTIDEVPFSIQSPQDAVPLLAMIGNDAESMALGQSPADVRPDTFASYASEVDQPYGVFTPADSGYTTSLIGSRRNGIVAINGGSAGYVSVAVDIMEPLLVGPCTYVEGEQKYFVGAGRFALNVAYPADLANRLLSAYLYGADAAPLQVEVSGDAFFVANMTSNARIAGFTNQEIYYSEITLPQEMAAVADSPWSFSFSVPQVYTTSVSQPVLAPSYAGSPYTGTFSSLALQSVVLNTTVVPDRLVVAAVLNAVDAAVQPGAAAATQTEGPYVNRRPNVCFPITNLSVSCGSETSLLSGASRDQLYEVATRGGVRLPFEVWSGQETVLTLNGAAPYVSKAYAGGPLSVAIEDLALPEGYFGGTEAQLQIQVQATALNHLIIPLTGMRLVTIALTGGVATCHQGRTTQRVGVPRAAVEAAMKTSRVGDLIARERFLTRAGYSGGNWFSDMTDGLSQGFMIPVRAAAKLGPLASMIAAPAALPAAMEFQKLVGGAAITGGRAKGRPRGGAALHLA